VRHKSTWRRPQPGTPARRIDAWRPRAAAPRWFDAVQCFRSAKSTFSAVWRPPLGSPRRILIRRESCSHRLHQRSQSTKQARVRTRATDTATLLGNAYDTAVREHGGRKPLDGSVIHYAEAQLTPLVFFPSSVWRASATRRRPCRVEKLSFSPRPVRRRDALLRTP
jgi:hypothetical protein